MFYPGINVAKAKLYCCLLLDEADKIKTQKINHTKPVNSDLLTWVAKKTASQLLHGVIETTDQGFWRASVRTKPVLSIV